MKLSKSVEQACCILALLADPKATVPITNDTLSDRMTVSPTYLKKISRKLVMAGLIKSAQGAGGGFVLAQKMQDITLYDVVVAIEGDQAFFQSQGIVERVFISEPRKVEIGMNLLDEIFKSAQEKWNKHLKTVTLADISKEIACD